VRQRLACTSSMEAINAYNDMTSNITDANVTVLPSFCFRGQCHPDVLHYRLYNQVVVEESVEDVWAQNEYTVHMDNVTRICEAFVDPACLTDNNADVCIANGINAILAARNSQLSSARGASPAAIIGASVAAGEHNTCDDARSGEEIDGVRACSVLVAARQRTVMFHAMSAVVGNNGIRRADCAVPKCALGCMFWCLVASPCPLLACTHLQASWCLQPCLALCSGRAGGAHARRSRCCQRSPLARVTAARSSGQ